MSETLKDNLGEQSRIKGRVRQDEGDRTEPLVTYDVKPRRVGMNLVSTQELEDLGSAPLEGSLYLALFGIAAGGLLTSGAALAVGGITNPYTFAGFVAAAIVSGLGTLCFGVLSYISMRRARERILFIRKESATGESELLDKHVDQLTHSNS